MNGLYSYRENQCSTYSQQVESGDYLVAQKPLCCAPVIQLGTLRCLIRSIELRLQRGYLFIRDVNYFWVKRRYSLRSSVSMAWSTIYW